MDPLPTAGKGRYPGWLYLAGGLLLLLFFFRLGSIPLLEPDEGRYAEIPREMLASGDFVTPHLNGVLYFEKPVLYYWLTAGSIRALGLNELACRLPSTLLALAGLGLAALLARDLAGRGVALLAAFLLGSSPVYFALARTNSIDMTVSFFLAATLAAFWLACEGPPERRRMTWYGCFLAAALAVLAKGLIGMVIPGAIIALYLSVTRGFRVLREVPWVGGLALFSAVAVPWHVLVAERNPSFLWFYFIHEHVLRYATNVASREEPWWFLAVVLFAGALPWSGLPFALLPSAARQGLDGRTRRGALFLALWAGFVLLFFSISKSKLVPYVLPAFLPLAVLAALVLRQASATRPGAAARALGAAAAALLLVIFGALGWLFVGGGTRWTEGEPLPTSLAWAGAVGAAAALVALVAAARGRLRVFAPAASGAVLALLLCLLLAAPIASDRRSARAMARYLAQHSSPGDRVIAFDAYPQTLPVYLGRTIDVADYVGELEFGIGQLAPAERAARFLSLADLAAVWTAPATTVQLVTEERSAERLRQGGLIDGPPDFAAGRYVLYVRRPAAVAASAPR